MEEEVKDVNSVDNNNEHNTPIQPQNTNSSNFDAEKYQALLKKQDDFLKSPAKKSDDFSIWALICALIPPLALVGLVLSIISMDYLKYTNSLDIKHQKICIAAIVLSSIFIACFVILLFSIDLSAILP